MNPQKAYQTVNKSRWTGNERRSPRVIVDAEIFLRQSEVQLFRATLSDLSNSGFRVVCYSPLNSSKPVFIRLPGLQILSADIRWHDHQDYGCEFSSRLHPSILDNLTEILAGS